MSPAPHPLHQIMLSEVRSFPALAQFCTDEVIMPADRLFSGCVQRGIDRGEFRPVPVKVRSPAAP